MRPRSAPYRERIDIGGCGLVYGMLFFKDRQTLTPDPKKAFRFCEKAVAGGNLFFAPVGKGRGAIKFAPPLSITKEAIDDGLYGLRGIAEVLKEVMQ
jgi:4-aminobutyrate aminotransferase-like enzyme